MRGAFLSQAENRRGVGRKFFYKTGEDFWATIGLVYAAVLYVVYTVRNEGAIRLISVGKANASEQKQYRQANA